MPGRDGTGPLGVGPMTGRGAGLCSYPAFGVRFAYRAIGGYGCQRGFRRQYYETGISGYLRNNHTGDMPSREERDYLSNQEIMLKQQLNWVKERLAEIDYPNE